MRSLSVNLIAVSISMTTTVSNATPCGLETDSRSDSSSPSLSLDESDTELDNVNRQCRASPSAPSGNPNPATGAGHKPKPSDRVQSDSDVAGWWLPADGHSVALVLKIDTIAKIFASLPLAGFLFCFVYSMLFQFDQVIDKDCPVCHLYVTYSILVQSGFFSIPNI